MSNYPAFPAPEAIRRLRALVLHQDAVQKYEMERGGDDPDGDALCYETSDLRPYTRDEMGEDSVYGEVCVGKQGDDSLTVGIPETTVDEVYAILNALR